MKNKHCLGRAVALGTALMVMTSACTLPSARNNEAAPPEATTVNNPVFHFEIPVTDMDRAVDFYQNVFELELRRQNIDGYEMAFFPRDDNRPGASGALAKGDVYKPSHDGVIIYFDVANIDAVLSRVTARGSKILYPKKSIGEAGYVAEFEDSEGNRIALTQAQD